MTVDSGILFLNSLYSRAMADSRLCMVETAGIAALAGGVSGLTLDEFGRLSFGNWQVGVSWAISCMVVWLVAYYLIQRSSQGTYRQYISSILLDTGLLYLVLEHDPHDALKPLKQRETIASLKINAASNVSFKQRILLFLRSYSACAGAMGFHPYPFTMRLISLAVYCSFIAALIIFGVKTYQNVRFALDYGVAIFGPVKIMAWIVLALIMVRATINTARKTGLWLALTDALETAPLEGKAILARR